MDDLRRNSAAAGERGNRLEGKTTIRFKQVSSTQVTVETKLCFLKKMVQIYIVQTFLIKNNSSHYECLQ